MRADRGIGNVAIRLGSGQDMELQGKWGKRHGKWELKPKCRQMSQADIIFQDPGGPQNLLKYVPDQNS